MCFGLFSFSVFSVCVFQCFRFKLYVGCGGIHSAQQDDLVSHTHTDMSEIIRSI